MISKHGIKTLKITGQKKTQVFNRDKGETQYERLSNFLFYGLDLDSVNTFNRTNSINKTLTQEKPDMSDYQTAKIVYKKGLAAVMQRLSQLHNVRPEIHGSEINDWVCDAYRGSGLAETATTEKILRGLVEVGVLTPLQVQPNHSQAAFAGLSYSKNGYQNVVRYFTTAYGLQTHFWFTINRGEI
jgi:hypothetical protein